MCKNYLVTAVSEEAIRVHRRFHVAILVFRTFMCHPVIESIEASRHDRCCGRPNL